MFNDVQGIFLILKNKHVMFVRSFKRVLWHFKTIMKDAHYASHLQEAGSSRKLISLLLNM